MNIENFFNKALAAQKDNNGALAKTLYQEILEADPAHLPSLFNLATVLANEYDFKGAKALYQKLIALEPDYVRGLFNCAWCCLQIHEIEQAKDYLIHAVALVPEYAAAQHLLGSILIKEGEFAKAEQHLTRALQDDPTLAEAYCHLGMVKIHQSSYDDAEGLLKQALTLAPFQAEAHYHLALVHLKRGDLSAAELCLQNAIDRDPQHFSALYNMALLKKQQHFDGLADAYLARAQLIKPEDPYVLFLRASLREDANVEEPPAEFIRSLFDGYASHYEQHMIKTLAYQVHHELFRTFEQSHHGKNITIVDLGCGTGLCGPLFKPYAKQLTGIDISPAMLDQAKLKNCYDYLLEGDLEEILAKMPDESVDVFIAADVLGYIGKLDDLFAQIQRVLTPQGLFLFSIESSTTDLQLNTSTRFSHGQDYIKRLCDHSHLDIQQFSPGILRKQEGVDVSGYYVKIEKAK